MNQSIWYEVPDVQLIVQDKDMACWFASALMVLGWKSKYTSRIDGLTLAMYLGDRGISNSQILPLALRLGLQPVPAQSPTIEYLLHLLKTFGPLWTNGRKHIVVIAGLRGDDIRGYEVKVYDPWPGEGATWRTLSGWYTGFNPGKYPESSRDTSGDVKAVFLHG